LYIYIYIYVFTHIICNKCISQMISDMWYIYIYHRWYLICDIHIYMWYTYIYTHIYTYIYTYIYIVYTYYTYIHHGSWVILFHPVVEKRSESRGNGGCVVVPRTPSPGIWRFRCPAAVQDVLWLGDSPVDDHHPSGFISFGDFNDPKFGNIIDII
jgi:hypothetical protein